MGAASYYQVIFIWVRDPGMFARYSAAVGPVAARYGGVERTVVPASATGLGDRGRPDLVNIAYFHSRDAVAALDADPGFLGLVGLRDQSVDLLTFGGAATFGGLTTDGLSDRTYVVELLQPGTGPGPRGPRTDPGYQPERVLAIDSVVPDDLPVVPAEARVGFFRGRNDVAPATAGDALIEVVGHPHPASLPAGA